jgi:nicotinamidase-related amidase
MADLERHAQGLGRRPALVLVDLVNGFTDTACPLGSETSSVVEACVSLLEAFRDKQLPVYFTTVVYHHADQARVFRKRLPALDVLQPDSHWVKIVTELTPMPGESIIEKQWASGFFKTDLNHRLMQDKADSLVVCGLTTSGCVRATAVDGLQNNFPVVVPEQAVGDRNEAAHRANLNDLNAKYADVLDLEAVLRIIRSL